ncbi:MAG: hypothetical protein HZC48_11175 [Nitrospirae bacterium]|nr:hypothetical protein [Nitrospirota bacterium]
MKRFILVVIGCFFVVVLTGRYSFAQMDDGMKMDEEMMKHMTEHCQPMMKEMMGDKKEMMQMMMDMMDMQEKTMKGTKAAEKKQMMKDMAQMKEKMQKMMSMRMDMTMGTGDPQTKLTCAEQWLKEAIDLHEIHVKDPKTATEASQMEMMDQMKKAYGCITGAGEDMSGTPSKGVESKEPKKAEPAKSDPHKH